MLNITLSPLNENGNAAIEMIPILAIFLLLVNFGMGFFGVIHSGILNSIAARNYAFETFRNRSNLNYLRDEGGAAGNPYYMQINFRFHSVVSEDHPSVNNFTATKRPIRFTDINVTPEPSGSANDHNKTIRSSASMADESKATSDTFSGATAQGGDAGVSPVWLMTSYGICLNALCCDPAGPCP